MAWMVGPVCQRRWAMKTPLPLQLNSIEFWFCLRVDAFLPPSFTLSTRTHSEIASKFVNCPLPCHCGHWNYWFGEMKRNAVRRNIGALRCRLFRSPIVNEFMFDAISWPNWWLPNDSEWIGKTYINNIYQTQLTMAGGNAMSSSSATHPMNPIMIDWIDIIN